MIVGYICYRCIFVESTQESRENKQMKIYARIPFAKKRKILIEISIQ